MKVRLDHESPEKYYGFLCPGCKTYHSIPTTGPGAWGFNDNVDVPTFTPSLLVRSKGDLHHGGNIPGYVCHSYITNGNIQFLQDCTHPFAGKTIPLPDMPLKGGFFSEDEK